MARRDSQIDVALRSSWLRAVVTVAVAAGCAALWWWAFRYFADTLDLDFLAWPVGILAALAGYQVVATTYRRFGPHAAPMHLSRGALRSRTVRLLRTLSAATHVLHPLGDPWPVAVVGPTGVVLVHPERPPGRIGYREGRILIDGAPTAFAAELRRLVPVVGELIVETTGVEVPVRGVVVVDDATVVPPVLSGGAAEIAVVGVSALLDRLTFGPPVPPERVRAAADALQRWRPRSGRIRAR